MQAYKYAGVSGDGNGAHNIIFVTFTIITKSMIYIYVHTYTYIIGHYNPSVRIMA